MAARPWLPVLALLAVASGPPPASWREFRDDRLGVTFRHPDTPGLRIVGRDPTCAPSDAQWDGGAADSIVVVTRTVAAFNHLAASLGFARASTGWLAQGAGDPVRAVSVQVNGWVALMADARTLAFDEKLQQPGAAKQWRLLAMGPARSECRLVMLGLAKAPAQGWDSATVAAVLESTGQVR